MWLGHSSSLSPYCVLDTYIPMAPNRSLLATTVRQPVHFVHLAARLRPFFPLLSWAAQWWGSPTGCQEQTSAKNPRGQESAVLFGSILIQRDIRSCLLCSAIVTIYTLYKLMDSKTTQLGDSVFLRVSSVVSMLLHLVDCLSTLYKTGFMIDILVIEWTFKTNS